MSKQAAVIIGGGPAGCQCALWLATLGYQVTLVEQKSTLGGLQAENPYHNHGLLGLHQTGKAWSKTLMRDLMHKNIRLLFNKIPKSLTGKAGGFDIALAGETVRAAYVVIATGVVPRTGNLKASMQILIGPGQTIHDYPFENKRVAILGGGDNAAENYDFIKKKNAKLCHVYSRTIRARHQLWSLIDEKDCYRYPYEINEETHSIMHEGNLRQYDVIVVLYGWEANFPHGLDAFKLDLMNSHGFIHANAHCETAVPGIFAIGEVTHRTYPSILTAMADGVIAAERIHHYLEKNNDIK